MLSMVWREPVTLMQNVKQKAVKQEETAPLVSEFAVLVSNI